MMKLKNKLPYLPFALLFAVLAASCGSEKKAEAAKAGVEAGHEEGEAGHEEGEAGHEEGETGHAEKGHDEGGGDRVTIPAASAEASGIGIATAGPGAIRDTITLTGRIMLQPSARAEVHAPYSGPVRAVSRNVGDAVRRGETLARVESAESLQTYSIVSPIAGVVLERQTNIGDVTGEEALFVVGDLSRLQAELNVAARDIGRVAAGQDVVITGLDGVKSIEARIATVLPTADAYSQTLIARAPISASNASALRPGMAVRGGVVVAESNVPVAVADEAVQTVEGRSVVFVRVEPDVYEARPVSLGRRGRDMVEITAGLKANEVYVSKSAFLVKAEIGKGEAGHDH